MTTTDKIKLGQIVISKAGRDKDKAYMVIKIIDESFLHLVDGYQKNFKKPKRKNIKHVQATNRIAAELVDKISAGTKVNDEEVRKIIQQLHS